MTYVACQQREDVSIWLFAAERKQDYLLLTCKLTSNKLLVKGASLGGNLLAFVGSWLERLRKPNHVYGSFDLYLFWQDFHMATKLKAMGHRHNYPNTGLSKQ